MCIRCRKKPEQGTEVIKFFDWAYTTGAKQANDLDSASLPDSVVEQVRDAWQTNIQGSSGMSLYQ
ncbi:phosphate ABC transporter substrate-binding protein PstS, partial [Escherichia coli]|nr:phosphate ABC transporter substrate-binding protein PstS [Escherichia coli]